MPHLHNGLLVGAYAMSPTSGGWNDLSIAPEQSYLRGVMELPHFGGLEVPIFKGHTIHHGDPELLLRFIREFGGDARIILTAIPATMQILEKTPHFGLASEDVSGREEAVAFAVQALKLASDINEFLGRPAVAVLQLHSAPGQAKAASSPEALERSLSALAKEDWKGVAVTIEHCDRFRIAYPPQKGFLPLEKEIEVLTNVNGSTSAVTSNQRYGLTINWGRSALEERDPGAVVAHLRAAKDAELLTGLIFSGCSERAYPGKTPWADVHSPPGPGGGLVHFDQWSLMTAEHMGRCLAVADPLALGYLGLKLGAIPHTPDETFDVEARLAILSDAMGLLVRLTGEVQGT